MTRRSALLGLVVLGLVLSLPALGPAQVSVKVLAPRVTIALVKVARGGVWIQRAGTLYPARIGLPVWESDVLMTGTDGALGVTFVDESLISLAPNSAFGILAYVYDPVTHVGRFEAAFYRGTMTATTGRMVRRKADTMLITTPQAVIHPRGTEFALRVGED